MRASFLKIPTFVVASKRWHPFGPALQIATAAVTDHIRIQKNRLVSESFGPTRVNFDIMKSRGRKDAKQIALIRFVASGEMAKIFADS
jgi:hypothetical protein